MNTYPCYYLPGVKVRGVQPELLEAHSLVVACFANLGKPCVVTSSSEGLHSQKSKHYTGGGRDYRSQHLTGEEKDSLLAAVRARLAPLGDFDFILEGRGRVGEHFHLEYDPKGPLNP